MKKTISILLAIYFFVISLSVSSFAISGKDLLSNKNVIINEWDEYNKIISMTDKELLNFGYTKQEIKEIRNFDYEKEIRYRATLDDKTLKAYGYTNKDIKELRQVATMDNIPDNVIKSISKSTLTSSLRYDSSGSRIEGNAPMYYVNLKYSWSWNRIPFFRIVDMVAIVFASSTSNSFTYYAKSNYKVHANLVALSSAYSNYNQEISWVYSTDKPNSISAKFSLGLNNVEGDLTHFAYSGYGYFQLTNRSNTSRLYIDACYGHTTVNVVPNYSLSGTGLSIGIDFRIGMDEQHCTGYFYEDFTIATNYIYHGTVYGKNNTGGSV